MSTSFALPGILYSDRSGVTDAENENNLTLKGEIHLGQGRSNSTDVSFNGDDLVRVELDPEHNSGGDSDEKFVQWLRVDDLVFDYGERDAARSDVGGIEAWNIRPPQDSSRGLLRWFVRKTLQVFSKNIAEPLAINALADRFEDTKLETDNPENYAGQGLYQCSLQAAFTLTKVDEPATAVATNRPCLLLIHGTASSTKGGFGGLWDSRVGSDGLREQLLNRYGKNCFAYEHHTLTTSPIKNALELAKQLPQGAELQLITHSRGGLIGELLCLGSRQGPRNKASRDELVGKLKKDADDGAAFGLPPLSSAELEEINQAYQSQQRDFEKLLRELDAKQFSITRFVRVACPARGTSLVAARLDRWLAILNHVADLGLGALGGAGAVASVGLDFVTSLVKQRTDPRLLPGLESMMPGSALTQLLFDDSILLDADLTVIAGDIDGRGLFQRLKVWIADWYFSSEHDLVVNTGSMYGGLPRTSSHYALFKGSAAHHSSYFRAAQPRRLLVEALLNAPSNRPLFAPLSEADIAMPASRGSTSIANLVAASRQRGSNQPLAIVLPGVMGSSLAVNGAPTWLNYWAIIRGRIRDMQWGNSGIAATGLLEKYYQPLVKRLAGNHHVEVVAYDWRGSVLDSANALADVLETYLPEAEQFAQPVYIIGHSMGGLVARSLFADGAAGSALWQRIKAISGSRLLMLGTPNHGSYDAVRMVTGDSKTLKLLALIDLANNKQELGDVVRQMPGLIDLLPYGSQTNFHDASAWQRLKAAVNANWNAPDEQPLVNSVLTTWQRLRTAAIEPEFMSYVAGDHPETVAAHRIESWQSPGNRRLNGEQIRYLTTARGDGTVTWQSGALPGVTQWRLENVEHGALCAPPSGLENHAFDAYIELLQSGTTSLLQPIPTARSGGAAEALTPLRQAPAPDAIPGPAELDKLLFNAPSAAAPIGSAAQRRISVSVRHGDLSYARYPVAVGHYSGEGIKHAEADLDARLDNALSNRMIAGIYPDALGRHATFINANPNRQPTSAIVIGLGDSAELTPLWLEAAVRDALLNYVLSDHARAAPSSSAITPVQFSFVLMGTGSGGLRIADSVAAILRGAVSANARLARLGNGQQQYVEDIEFVEIYQDSALAVASALEQINRSHMRNLVHWVDRQICEGEGRRSRIYADEHDDDWQRLTIQKQCNGLKFEAAYRKARAERSLAPGQLKLVDQFIARATAGTGANPEIGKTLFELLLPVDLRTRAARQGNTLLLLDAQSAAYPWELLENRWGQSQLPPSVQSGMLRQLSTDRHRAMPTYAEQDTALVIANPALTNGFADLPGAAREGKNVDSRLQASGFSSTAIIGGNAAQITASLHKNKWRILHLAGHGVHQTSSSSGCRTESGMVIDDDLLLTPGDIDQMRWVPELVFINCCYLGKTEPANHALAKPAELSALAANLAVQFIRMGVRAVVAAGWEVEDRAAETFADKFYEQLLGGSNLGDTVRAAREAVYIRHKNVNTWGAFQCYGNPGWSLGSQHKRPANSGKTAFHSPAQMVLEINNLTETLRLKNRELSGKALEQCFTAARRQLQDYRQQAPGSGKSRWNQRADVLAALGAAYAEIGDWQMAEKDLRAALQASCGECPLSALDNWFHAQLCVISHHYQSDPKNKKAPEMAEQVSASLSLICHHNAANLNIRRWKLAGGAYRLLAMWQARNAKPKTAKAKASACLDSLQKMHRYYHEANEHSSKQNCLDPEALAYTSYAVLAINQATSDDKQNISTEPVASQLNGAKCDCQHHAFPNHGLASAQLTLALALLNNSLDAKTGEIILTQLRGSPGPTISRHERRIIIEQLCFVQAMVQQHEVISQLLESLQSL